jgi:3-oxoacyl-[acyl-carrier protein] reductase
VGRRSRPLGETADTLDGDAFVVPADVSTAEGVEAVRAAVAGASVPTVIHAAAIEGLVRFADTDRPTFDRLVATNLAGPFFLTQALLPRLGAGSSIVFVASVAAVRGRDRHAAYSATKAALYGLTVNLAAELAPNVRVNCVSPGAVQTPMFDEAVRDYFSAVGADEAARVSAVERSRLLLGIAQPEELAASIVHLALDATFVTGTILYADGGYTAR